MNMSDKKYRERDWLYEQYTVKDKELKEIADEIDVHYNTIWKWKEKLEIPEPKYKRRKWLYQEYHEKERESSEIAKEFDIHPSTVNTWRKRLDIPQHECYSEYKCYICNESFQRLDSKAKNNNKQFCSRECVNEWKSQLTGEDAFAWKDKSPVSCEWCGKEFFVKPFKEKNQDNFFCDIENCFSRWWMENYSGKNAPTWRGGYKDYYGESWNEQRMNALNRDDFKCKKCSVEQKDLDEELSVHHIEPFRNFDESSEANKLENLVSLCRSCHMKVEWGGETV